MTPEFLPESKPEIAFCFALKEEAAPFRKFCAGKKNVSIFLTGIGHKNAEKAALEFLKSHSPKMILACGFAGGLNPGLKTGEVIFEIFSDEAQIKIGTSEPARAGCCNLKEKLLAAGAKPAKFFCANRIATTVAEKKKLRAETGADAVEMESETMQNICRERGISCATVRVISDSANETLPLDFNALSKPDKNLDFGKLFLAIAKSPGKIPALMKLQKQTQFAAEKLAEVLAKIIAQ